MSKESDLEPIRRLINIAKSDTGQSGRVANFLLAWWNADRQGGFNLVDLWMLDTAIVNDMTKVFGLIARFHSYPDAWGLEADFHSIIAEWRHSKKHRMTIRDAVELIEDAGLSSRLARGAAADGLILHAENRSRFPSENAFSIAVGEDATISNGKAHLQKKITEYFGRISAGNPARPENPSHVGPGPK